MIEIGRRAVVVSAVLLSTVLVSTLACRAAWGQAPEKPKQTRYERRPDGERFRVGFDQGSRWLIGGGAVLETAGPAPLGFGRAETALGYRHLLDYPLEDVAWKMYHLGLHVTADLGIMPDSFQDLAFSGTLYRGRFHRWTRHGYIMLPSSPPRRLPFPLNIGVETLLARFETRPAQPETFGVLDVLAADIVFDFWRSRRLGSWAQVGLGTSYRMDFPVAGALQHVVAPFSRATLAAHHEWEDGRQTADMKSEVAYVWTSQPQWRVIARASAEYEVIFLAINDQALSAYTEIAWRYDQTHDVRATAGLRLGISLPD